MRTLLSILLAFVICPAFARGWTQYDNARFGFAVDIPPGFVALGESDNGDGQVFALAGKPVELSVWGGTLTEADFEAEVAQRMRWDEDEAWNLTYQAVTPRWASWSAIKGSRILYQRMVLLCGGPTYAAFRTEYSLTDSAEMDQAVEQMVGSLNGAC